MMRNTVQRIQRFYRSHLDQKENINDKKERIRMDVFISLLLYGNIVKKFLKKRRRKIIPNFMYKTRFFFQFDYHFERYRNKGNSQTNKKMKN